MRKIKHFLLTLAFLISFTTYSFSKEYENNSLFLKIKNNVEINFEKKNDKIWTSFLNKHNILKISKAFRSQEMQQYYLVETKSNANLITIIEDFKTFSFVEFSERVPIYKLFFTPNDPQYNNQWNLVKIQADQAWNINQGSTAIKIAVIDDGFLLNHEDLASQWHINTNEIPNNNIDDDNNGYIDDWRGWDAANNDNNPSAFTPANSYFTHGTHVAGIVAAATNNSLGIASIGFNCKMIPVKIGDDASSSLSGAYLGVEYAIMSGANIMNMSWGGSGYSATYQALFNLAKSKGMVCVAAAGNSSTSIPMYPASYNNVISVASSTITDALSSFTNYGTTIDVTAPGSDILSSLAGGISNYGIFSGTSMASPLVAGICGLMMSNNLGMHPDSVEACLKRSCDNIDAQNPTKTGQFGAGRVNAFKALQCTQKAPLADFEVLDTFQCVNTIVRYKSNSSGIQPLTYSWSFPGGNPSTSTLVNPQVTYSSPGLYSATLTVTNSFGTHSVSKTNIVRIGTPTATLSGRKYTTYGTNAAILAINFIGTPPYNITLTDGSNVWTQNNITSNPYFYSITPIKDTSIIQIQSFSDKNCVGIGSVNDTIIKLNTSSLIYKDTCIFLNNDPNIVEDACVVTSFPNNSSPLHPEFGSLSWTCGGSPCQGRSLLKFNLNEIPQNAIINSATLYLTAENPSNGYSNQPTFGTNNTSVIKRITQTWSENTVTWNNQPTTTSLNQVTLPQSTSTKQNYVVNMAQLINDSRANPNNSYGFMLQHLAEPTWYNCMLFASTDYSIVSKRPKLEICYSIPIEDNSNIICDTTCLILCMAMDGNANDSTKYNNHGIIRGATPTIGRDGKTNSAYYFNGTTNHINLGVKNILKPSAASISVWVKPQTFNSYIGTNSNTIIITKNPNNPSSFMEGYSLSLTNRTGPTKYMAINTHQPTNNEKWFMSNQNTNINQWTHIVLTFDFDSIKLYVNGQLDNKIYKGFNNVYDAFDSVVIGYSANIINKNYYKGDIDELKMYNRVLSSSEILSLYTKPFTCSCASSSSSNQTDCDTTNLNVGKVLHLDFNGNTQDKSGNNNHATNFGATLVAGKDGLANSAYRFNGSSNYMQVANNSSINSFSNNKITLCAIVKPKGFYNGICYGNAIIDKGSQDFLTGNYLLRYSPIHPSASCTIADVSKSNFYGGYYNGGCTYSEIDNSPKVKIDTWYCVVNTYDGDTIKTYVDGILRHKCLFIGGIGSNIQDVFIGRKNNTTFPYWHNGDIDDIRIYNRALSASEVKGYCGTCNISPPISVKCDTGKKYIYTKCFNDTIQLNVGKGKNHQWSPTTDLSNGTIQNPKCFAKSSIQYFVLYNDTNNCQIIDTLQINVFPSNHIPLFDSNVCIGDSIFYSLDNNGTNYNWNPNQYLSSNNQSSAWIKPFANTSYNISYKDINGCIILDTFNIKTKACCDLKAQFEISDSIICKSGVVSIFNKSKNITNGIYNWDFKNLTPSQYSGYSPASITLNSPGTYSIKLKTSNGICEDSMTRNIYVIDIKANAGKDSIFCTGRISNFKIGETNSISDYKYSWNPTLGLNNADISSPTVNISQNQQYELSVFDPFTGCIALDTIILTINSNLDTFNYVDTLCEGDTKVFFDQNIMIDGTYQHYVKDNQNCDIEVHILKVFFRKISYTNSIQKACNFYIDKMGIKHTDSFEYNDTTYTKGCITNIHTTKIKILKTRYEETDMTACYKINWKGNTYFDTIKKIDSFVFKDNGCDTLVKYVNLNIVKKAEIKIISTHANPLNYGEEIILQAFGSNNYKWNTGERGFQISHKAKENNVFYVIGYNNVLCPDTAYYNIYIDNNSGIELPDIFSPNEDGKNDIFRPNYKGNVQILDFIIFNRWGEKIYEGHGNESFWDGKYKGEYQSSGVYIYLFNYIFNGKQVSKKGSFVLVR